MRKTELKKVIKRLEEYHTPAIIPPCPVCGGSLSLDSYGGEEPTRYACSGYEDDPDKPGCIRLQAGRGLADDHYSKSSFIDRRHDDPDVMTLIKEFRKLQRKLENFTNAEN